MKNNKVIFDLGSNNIFHGWYDMFDSDWMEYKCRVTFLECQNNHLPWDCNRRKRLEECMFTRPIKKR